MKSLVLVLLLLTGAAQAQTVYRCGTDGRSYSDTPCRDGRAIDVSAPRPSTDLADARDTARREQQLAERLQQERAWREAQSPAGAAGIRGARGTGGAVEPSGLKPRWKTKAAPDRGHRLQRQHPLEDDGTYREAAPSSRQTKG